jgi:hypothetical protein
VFPFAFAHRGITGVYILLADDLHLHFAQLKVNENLTLETNKGE